MSERDSPKPITDHLEDLRGGLVRALLASFTCVGLTFWQSRKVFYWLVLPLESAIAKVPELASQTLPLQTLNPVEIFFTDMKISLAAGMAAASPFLLREIWIFVAPGLKPRERKAILPALGMGLLFFALGVVFAYYVAVPLTLRFFLAYNVGFHVLPQWTLGGYVDFMLTLLVSFGMTFELPLILAVLAGLGLVTPEFLTAKRRHAILGIVILAAVVTPTVDPFTQMALSIPLFFLYELGILFARIASRRRKEPEIQGPHVDS